MYEYLGMPFGELLKLLLMLTALVRLADTTLKQHSTRIFVIVSRSLANIARFCRTVRVSYSMYYYPLLNNIF